MCVPLIHGPSRFVDFALKFSALKQLDVMTASMSLCEIAKILRTLFQLTTLEAHLYSPEQLPHDFSAISPVLAHSQQFTVTKLTIYIDLMHHGTFNRSLVRSLFPNVRRGKIELGFAQCLTCKRSFKNFLPAPDCVRQAFVNGPVF